MHRLDRTSRKLLGFASLLDELQLRQIPLTVVTSPDGTATKSLIANILMSFAEFEADMTRERMADTRRALKFKGRRVAGRFPYGYTTDPRSKQLIIVPAEASHIRAMFALAGCVKQPERFPNRPIARDGTRGRRPSGLMVVLGLRVRSFRHSRILSMRVAFITTKALSRAATKRSSLPSSSTS